MLITKKVPTFLNVRDFSRNFYDIKCRLKKEVSNNLSFNFLRTLANINHLLQTAMDFPSFFSA